MKKIMLLILGIVCLTIADEVKLCDLQSEANRRCNGSSTNFCKAMKHYDNNTFNTYDKMIVCGYLGKSANLNVISKYDGLEVNLKYYSDSALALMATTILCPEIARDFQ